MKKKMALVKMLTLCAATLAFAVRAAPTSAEQAVRAVEKWLVGNAALGCDLGASAADVRTLNTAGGARFHLVRLRGGGFVIVAGDTAVEPIIAFSAASDMAESVDNPLYRLLDADLSRRPVKSLKFAAKPVASVSALSAEEAKWARLLGDDETDPLVPQKIVKTAAAKSSVSDCRVAPLLTSEWSQTGPRNVIGETARCYNYYTPNNYPCGCVATACAQIMYYHRQPAALYDWAQMVDKPAKGISDAGARAIGRLTADIGAHCQATYTPHAASISGYMIAPLLTDVYGYGSAIAFQSTSEMSVSGFKSAIIPNLDAKLPVAVGLSDNYGYGHEVVADGYGYDSGTFYLHVNMGWAGLDDAWYAPPAVGDYDFIDGVVCNIDPAGSVKNTLVSGRVLDAKTGKPVAGAKVSADGVMAETDANGIYALALEPGAKTIVATCNSRSASVKVVVKANVGTPVDFAASTFFIKPMTIANQYDVDLALDVAGADPVEPVVPVAPPEDVAGFTASREPFTAAVAMTMAGVALAADGSVAGVVQLKVGKASKKGVSKVSLTLTGRDGGKCTAKPVNVSVDGGFPKVTLDVRNYGLVTLTLGDDGFIGATADGARLGMMPGGPLTGEAAVNLAFTEELPFENILEEYLPTDVVVSCSEKKWSLPKAGKLKYVKANPKKGVEAALVATGENIAALKLAYAAKTQTVKGSFKIWTLDEAKASLKSVSVNVTGVVAGGAAYCDVTYKKRKIGELSVAP